MSDSTNHHNHHSQPAAAIGGKTARACDGCIRRRARWFCAADDAFLCDPCDSHIHSANQLAGRHHRLRLKSSSSTTLSVATPSWHHGFTRKPRTPRSHHKPLVPDLESSVEEEEEGEQLLYRVPVFDPPSAVPPDTETEDFSADMESLLGREFDRGGEFCMEELGLGGAGGGAVAGVAGDPAEKKGKIEEKGEILGIGIEGDLCRENLEIDFGEEIKEEIKVGISKGMGLSLDYEAVKEAWMVTGSSPWMTGERPRMGVEDYWHECLGKFGETGGEFIGSGTGIIQFMDLGREARVTRYREKRRTRLFSKKIRYEVRKLNAEKRPRMKGRFVKRTDVFSS
uniref:CONSTANS-like 12 n=1 Tax=Erycina pusilla TaxID=154679 RepID=M9QTP9_9ASPA|nr:CONSTANS-like 12 [Erycina pusilla]